MQTKVTLERKNPLPPTPYWWVLVREASPALSQPRILGPSHFSEMGHQCLLLAHWLWSVPRLETVRAQVYSRTIKHRRKVNPNVRMGRERREWDRGGEHTDLWISVNNKSLREKTISSKYSKFVCYSWVVTM